MGLLIGLHAIDGFLQDLDIHDVVLALCKLLCLEDILAILANGNTAVLITDFNNGRLLVGFTLEEDGGYLGRKKTVLDELFDVAVIFHNLDLLLHHFGCLLDRGSFLANRQSHVTGVDHKDEPGIALIENAVAAPCTGQALELGDQAHTVFSEFHFNHIIMPS